MKNEQELAMLSGVIILDNLYFSNSDLNGLYRMNLSTKECKFVAFFPHEPIIKDRLYFHASCYMDQIVFSPFYAHHIAVFDLKTEEFKTYSVPKTYWGGSKSCEYMAVTVYGKYAYFYGRKATILRFNLENGEMKYWDESSLGIDKSLVAYDNFGFQIRQSSNYIYNIIHRKKYMFRFSLLTESMEIFPIDLTDEQLSGIEANEDKVWLITDRNIWEWKESAYEKYINYECQLPSIIETFLVNGQFLLCGQNNFEIVIISKREASINTVVFNDGFMTKMSYMPNLAFYIGRHNGNGVYFSAFDNSIYLLDWNFNIKETIRLIDKGVDKFKTLSNEENEIIVEGAPSINTMQYFMDIVYAKDKDFFKEGKEKDIGNKIHKHIICESY